MLTRTELPYTQHTSIPNLGVMGPSLVNTQKYLWNNVRKKAKFIELQVHDNLKQNISEIRSNKLSFDFDGYLTFHGEGETDGIKKIHLSSPNESLRKRYVKESAELYVAALEATDAYETTRFILHPDNLISKYPRPLQIKFLAHSLTELSDSIDRNISICIEPRGGGIRGKVIRNYLQDIKYLQEELKLLGAKRIGLCIDIAQSHIVHGKEGILGYLNSLKLLDLPVKEFHISDVLKNKHVKNKVAMEIGTGSINWSSLLSSLLFLCNDLLIETLGGIKVFQRSVEYLQSLHKYEILL